jgi:hypothetical protein
MGEDEGATVRTLNAHREVIGALVGRHIQVRPEWYV